MADQRTFGDLIRDARVALAMTQESLGQSVGVKQSTVSTWELNSTVPDVRTLRRLAEVLEIELPVLLLAAAVVAPAAS